MLHTEKVPSEMEVAPRYKLITLYTLFTLFTLFTLLPLLTLFTLFTRFKQLWSKKALMPIHMATDE